MDVRVRYFEAQNHCCYPITTAKRLNFCCNLFCEDNHTLQCLVIEVIEVVNLLLWNDQSVSLCEWIDVEECVITIVFSDLVAWNLSSYDS